MIPRHMHQKIITQLGELYRANPEQTTHTVEVKPFSSTIHRIKYKLEIDGLKMMSVGMHPDTCLLEIEGNTIIDDLPRQIYARGHYGHDCDFATAVFSHIGAINRAMPMPEKYRRTLIDTLSKNRNRINHIMNTPLERKRYELNLGRQIHIFTANTAPDREQGESRYCISAINRNPKIQLPNYSTYIMNIENPVDRAAAIEFSREMFELMRDLYRGQHVR